MDTLVYCNRKDGMCVKAVISRIKCVLNRVDSELTLEVIQPIGVPHKLSVNSEVCETQSMINQSHVQDTI